MNCKTAWSRLIRTGIVMAALAFSIGLPGAYAYAEEGAAETADSYPSAFDLRDVDGHSYVTPVKFQNPFGTCWGFAATAAAETSVLGSHFEDDPMAYRTLDFSEKQLAYFSNTHLDDFASTQNGEGIYSTKYVVTNEGEIILIGTETSEDHYTGGTQFLATNTFAAGSGPTHESRSDALVYKGKEGTIRPLEDGTPYHYSADDDWTLGEEYRYLQDYVLKESYMLPTPADYSTEVYQYNEEGTNAIKEQLLQKRAVCVAFHSDMSMPWNTGYGVYLNVST